MEKQKRIGPKPNYYLGHERENKVEYKLLEEQDLGLMLDFVDDEIVYVYNVEE